MEGTITVGPETLTVRPVDPRDLADLLELYRQCEDFLALGPQPHASVAMVEADLGLSRAHGGIFCAIYDSAGRIVGVLDYVPGGHGGRPKAAFLELFMLGARYRGRGWGAAIVSALHAELACAGARAIAAGVQVNNPAAQRFWQRMGYRVTGPAEDNGDGTTGYPLARPLP